MKKAILVGLYAILTLGSAPTWGAEITALRLWHAPDRSRFVFDIDTATDFKVFTLENPARVVVDLSHSKFTGSLPAADKLGQFVSKIRSGHHQSDKLRFVFDVAKPVRYFVQQLKPINNYKYRLVIDFYNQSALQATRPTGKKKPLFPSEVQQRGDIVIAIDAGHGGEDPGALGRHSREKDIVLKIAKQLKAMIDKEPGMRAYLTRSGDYYVDLRKRIRLAREQHADLFISIHADAFKTSKPAGASVYALSQSGATSEEARWLANKENAADLIGGASIANKDDIVAEAMLDMSMTKTVQESLAFGNEVLKELAKAGKLHSRRVEQAGFAVLKSPDIPSILVETAYISNPTEERALNNPRHQRRLAKAVLQGTKHYLKKNRQTYGS